MAKQDMEITFSKEVSEVIRKIQNSSFVCASCDCINHYRSKANCMLKEIVIEKGKCIRYEKRTNDNS